MRKGQDNSSPGSAGRSNPYGLTPAERAVIEAFGMAKNRKGEYLDSSDGTPLSLNDVRRLLLAESPEGKRRTAALRRELDESP
jgi:hypothetical protein